MGKFVCLLFLVCILVIIVESRRSGRERNRKSEVPPRPRKSRPSRNWKSKQDPKTEDLGAHEKLDVVTRRPRNHKVSKPKTRLRRSATEETKSNNDEDNGLKANWNEDSAYTSSDCKGSCPESSQSEQTFLRPIIVLNRHQHQPEVPDADYAIEEQNGHLITKKLEKGEQGKPIDISVDPESPEYEHFSAHRKLIDDKLTLDVEATLKAITEMYDNNDDEVEYYEYEYEDVDPANYS